MSPNVRLEIAPALRYAAAPNECRAPRSAKPAPWMPGRNTSAKPTTSSASHRATVAGTRPADAIESAACRAPAGRAAVNARISR